MTSERASALTAQKLLRAKLIGRGSDHEESPHNRGSIETREKAVCTIRHLLEHTILNGEGNSLLVIGPRGSGKSWILDRVFSQLAENKKCKGNFLKVHLNGLVQTDDRLALLEVARQLDIECELGEKITLSFAAALNHLLETLRTGSHANQSIVFVLDEFDLFAHHKNQTLLYNLFDVSQSAHNPIAVIGVTCRLDAVELLEKRVKSRFSHRQINLFCDFSFEEYLALVAGLLSLPAEIRDETFRKNWEKHLKEVCSSVKVRSSLRKFYNASPDLQSLKALLTLPVCKLGIRHAYLEPSDFVQSAHLMSREATAAMLHGVSILELCLIIAMKHIYEVSKDETLNFEMVYNEYKKFAQRSHSVEYFGKPVALKAFEHLISLEVVCPADSAASVAGSNKLLKEFRPMMLMLEEEQITLAIKNYPNCPTDVTRWGTLAGIV